ncbi:MAG: hypothetical protein HC867_01895 [Bacteroidia bacterium]|nr:hypothetical protein [Bacteroidia bacterium]
MFNDVNKFSNLFFAGVETLLNQNNTFCLKQYAAKYGTPVVADVQLIQAINGTVTACYAVGDTVCTFISHINGKPNDVVMIVKNTATGKRYYMGYLPANYPAYLAIIELLSSTELHLGSFFSQP